MQDVRRIRMAAIAMAALVVALPVGAADWKLISTEGSEDAPTTTTWIDASSIRRTGNRVKAWIRLNHAESQAITVSFAEKFYVQYSALFVFDCHEHSQANLQAVYYDREGNVVYQFSTNERLAPRDEVVPDSRGDIWLTEACKRAPKFVPDKPKAPPAEPGAL